MTNKQLSASIVLYRTSQDELEGCLGSLRRFDPDIRLFLVDNSPTDELASMAVGQGVSYHHLPHNPGYGRAHNVAIRRSFDEGYAYHLVLNADIHFQQDILSPMLAYMDANPAVGLMMPMVRNPDGSIQRLCKLLPTPADLLFRRFMPRAQRERRNRRFELHQSGYDRIMFVPYLSGCFMLLRQSILHEVGGFDERFFMYGEDIDLSRRMAQKSDNMFFPDVSVTHAYGAASYKSLKMLYIHAMNVSRYFNKWGWLADRERDAMNRSTLRQFE